jgi:predicted transcriptional regulator
MVQQFQMKQAADEDRRTSIAKTGVLDTTTMINYRWSEDIFLKNQTVADGKSHGMIMYLDWSGSMDCILKDTVEQLLILTEFCNKMQIPFEVYAFTSRQINGDFINDKGNVELKELEWMTPADNAVGCRQLRAHSYSLINFLSSRMNIRQYKKAVRELFLCSNQRYGDIPNQFSTGCTPLNEAIMCALQQVPAFQERTGVQIVNTVFLTDGEGHSMGASNYRYNSEKTYIHDPSTRKDYALNNDHRDETNVYLEILRNRTQCNIIGIRLHCAKNISNLRYSYIEENDIEASQRSFKKNNYCVASKGKTAYDEFFIVKADLNATEDIFAAIDDDASFAKIKNAFKKNAKSTKTSRVIATKMIEIFATNK